MSGSDQTQDHNKCKIVETSRLDQIQPMIACVMCGNEYHAAMMWWKGTEYCEHGVPMESVPVCFPCVLAAEAQLSGATVLAMPMEMREAIEQLASQSSETPKTHD